ncbi:MAG TPA: hypothetical protein VN733_02300 [Solirubrobacterales bacterium]|nr:hypothetical protein [Solirubrobacterales bacterium]
MLSRRLLPIVAALTLALGPGCGSGGEESSTQPASAAGQADAGAQAPSTAGQMPASDAKDTAPDAQEGGARKQRSEGKTEKRADQKQAATPGGGKPSAATRDGDSPCPDGVSRERCLEMIRSSESAQSTSKPVPQGRCPASYSKAQCAAAVQAWEEAEAGSQQQEPGQCPPSISREDCEKIAREAGY